MPVYLAESTTAVYAAATTQGPKQASRASTRPKNQQTNLIRRRRRRRRIINGAGRASGVDRSVESNEHLLAVVAVMLVMLVMLAIVRANAMLLMNRVAHTGGTSRGFLCPQVAAERGSSMGGAVIGGWTLRALSRGFRLLSSPTFLGASTHFGSTFLLHGYASATFDARGYLVWTSLGIIFFLRSLYPSVQWHTGVVLQ